MMHTIKKPCVASALMALAFAIFAAVLLAAYNAPYLKTVEGLNVFQSNEMFFDKCMQRPGGLLAWAASWLTQLFYHPWGGACAYAALLGVLCLACRYAFKLPASLTALAAVPSAMLLLSFLNVGYAIFSFKAPGMPFTAALGSLVAVLSLPAIVAMRRTLLRLTFIVLLPTAGYYCFGFYALLGAGLCVLTALAALHRRNDSLHRCAYVTAAMLSVLLIIIFPPLCQRYMMTTLMPADIYTAGLPAYYPTEGSQWTPYIIAFGLMALGAIWASIARTREIRLKETDPDAKPAPMGTAALAVGCIAMAAVMAVPAMARYRDGNFEWSLAARRAVIEGDWDRATRLAAANQDIAPTRLNVLLTDIALMRKGVAGDSLFTYRVGSAPYNTERSQTAMRDAVVQLVSYHFGRINNAYRWAMEYSVEYGFSPDNLTMLAKCAILHGEYQLARKYTAALQATMHHKALADELNSIIDRKEEEQQSAIRAEMEQIRPLMAFRDHLGGDGGKVEPHLLPALSGLAGGTPQLLDLSLQCNLIQKNIDGFIMRFMPSAGRYERIPAHYQEAVLMYTNGKVPAGLPIDPAKAAEYKAFEAEIQQCMATMPKDAAAMRMHPRFGRTLWYYVYFVENDKKNIR